ncbi:odorant receptor 33c-like [Drosophila sulfurigaster albostrigata]|uniref:odorant receptor 33c-like n=1 Tax=Drosophila sulfurigaster albostrigata TaxID=89887 RepID=UPI002D219DD9|nr:odorant receptor 33c-like [Drosophila sulfurigaster albostrigata]
MNVDIDSTRAYRPLWLSLRVLAPTFLGSSSHLVLACTLLLHLLVTLMFPLHLLLGLLLQATPAEMFKNLTMSLTCAACSLKHIMHLWHLPHMLEISTLLQQLDDCILSDEELDYYQHTLQWQVNRITRCIYISFAIVYIFFVPIAISVLLSEKHELLYLAWFPFDWHNNDFKYALAIGYQFFSILTEGLQGLINDIYTPLTLCYVSGHLHMFGIRMARLGFHRLPGVGIQQQLLACIQDFKLLMRLHELTRVIISYVQLTQLLFCGTNLCIIVIYALFYTEDIATVAYNIVYFMVVCIQLFPSCYFASVLAEEAQRLPNAIFSGNWYEQSAEYRRNVLIFTQMTLRLMKRPMMAGGLIELNLNAFFVTVKMAYSLFAVVVQSK